MATLFLILIYMTFISLGLPDSLLGTAWPLISPEFGVPVSAVGAVSITINVGTIVSSLLSVRLLTRFGTGKVTAVSVMMTALGLTGFAFSHSLWFLVICAVPLGLGAGAIDSGLNEYVAEHYKAYHMSWLHSFWGLGALLGPMIMSFTLRNDDWRGAYLTVAGIQWGIVILLFVSLPLWKKQEGERKVPQETKASVQNKSLFYPLRIKGIWGALIAFFCYCAVEYSFNLWGSSFLTAVKGLDPSTAASWVSAYYMGITFGRLASGFVMIRVGSKQLIRLGQVLLLCGAGLMLLPLPRFFTLLGIVLAGIGCAPVFPCMLHETPNRFGIEDAQQVMGFQMGFSYFGGTVIPPLFGMLAKATTFTLYPWYLLLLGGVMLIGSECVNHFVKQKGKTD